MSHIWPNMQTNSVTRCLYLMVCLYLGANLGNALMKNDIYNEAKDDEGLLWRAGFLAEKGIRTRALMLPVSCQRGMGC